MRTTRTTRFGHVDLPVFGEGKDIPAKTWQSVYRAASGRGALSSVDHEAFGPHIKSSCPTRPAPVFKHERECVSARTARRGPKTSRRTVVGVGEPAKTALGAGRWRTVRGKPLRARRAWRSQGPVGWPPYVGVSRHHAGGLAHRAPARREALLAISGVGQSKLEGGGAAMGRRVSEGHREFGQ